MEGWFSMCFIALCTPLALWLLKLASTKNKPQKQQQLPPGPWTLPIIGSLHHVASILPHCTMMKLSRRHGALMLLRLGEVPIVIVSSAEVAAEVMKTNDPTFASRPRRATSDFFGSGGKGIVYAPYGDHWRQMRKICVMELLSSTQVKRMEAIRAEKVMALSNDMVTRAVFGGKFPHQGEYLRELAKAFTMLGGFSMLDLFPSSRLVRWLSNDQRQMKSCYGRMHRIIADVVEERKATRAARAGISIASDEDMLDVLLRLQQEDSLIFPLTTQTMGAILFDVFAGATESGGNVLAWAMSELMHSPNTMVKAQEEVREVLGEGRAVTSRKPTFDLEH